MLGNRPMTDWVAQYSLSHQNAVNRWMHTFGIPMIVVSLLLGVASIGVPGLRQPAFGLFIAGWVLQFVGHAFEGKAPEFFQDWRFLFVGLRWWLAKVSGASGASSAASARKRS
jgi:uncharacterized membrane protein YGL010W